MDENGVSLPLERLVLLRVETALEECFPRRGKLTQPGVLQSPLLVDYRDT